MATEWSWLTINEFLNFVIDQKINLDCRRCGKRWPADNNLVFNAYDEEDGFMPFVSSYTIAENGNINTFKSRHIASVRVTCNSCGTIDHYSGYVVKRWRDNKTNEALLRGPNNG